MFDDCISWVYCAKLFADAQRTVLLNQFINHNEILEASIVRVRWLIAIGIGTRVHPTPDVSAVIIF
jgi:hypothetical protein